jgi:predicted phosphodiesterase
MLTVEMREHTIQDGLYRLYKNATLIPIDDRDRFVIFSDFHLGNRTSRDDFASNSELFMYILEHYYLQQNYTLVLNGDIEELQKFDLYTIKKNWSDLYDLFDRFDQKKQFYKLIGNHDIDLYLGKHTDCNRNLKSSLRLDYKHNPIFIFHGHQASSYYRRANRFITMGLRYIATPLGIKNITRAYNNQKVHKTEQRIYNFSYQMKIISIIGHTHRPLFESLSENDLLKFKMEYLLREYAESSKRKQKKLLKHIEKYKQKIKRIYEEENRFGSIDSIYNSDLIVPVMFNSGCVIGKKGLTAIEIENGNISLVHWFDKGQQSKYFDYEQKKPEQLGSSKYFKLVIKSDDLDYIFTRIKLLT